MISNEVHTPSGGNVDSDAGNQLSVSASPAPVEAAPLPVADVKPSEPPRIVAVVGEIPFAGARVAQALVQAGFVVRVLCPDENAENAALRAAGQSGVATIRGSLDTVAAVEQAMDGAYAACFVSPIIMAGRVYRRSHHVQDAARFVETAQAKGVQKIVYHSALGAHATAVSQALRDAAAAEERVKTAKCKTYIARTGPLMGLNDGFLATYLAAAKSGCPFSGIIGYGSTTVQPLHVNDMARCVARLVLNRPDELDTGKYSLAGPESLTLLELTDLADAHLGRSKFKFHVPLSLVRLVTMFCSDKSDDAAEAGLKERYNLLYDSFQAERNDAPRLLGPGETLLALRQTCDEILTSSAMA